MKMKTLVAAVLAAVAVSARAEGKKAPAVQVKPAAQAQQELTPEERAARRLKAQRKSGGKFVVEPRGTFLIVNCQDVVPEDSIVTQRTTLASLMRIKVESRRGSWKLGDALPADATQALYLVNDATLPPSLLAPEARWGVINCARLGDRKRFDKMFIRTAVRLLHGSASQQPTSVMQPVDSVEGLDRIVNAVYPVDLTMAIYRNLAAQGFVQSRLMSYRAACMQGLATAPTNEIQKAVWDEVHAIPKKPLKIEFDAKKGL